MRVEEFNNWLIKNSYRTGTCKSRIANCIRVSDYEGDLDMHFETDNCQSVLDRLTYSKSDQVANKPKKHSIPIDGDIYTGTATLKQAVKLYIDFCRGESREATSKISYSSPNVNAVERVCEKQDSPLYIEKRDSYERFLNIFNIKKEDFYKFGIQETIFPPFEKVEEQWNDLIDRIMNNKTVYIRGYGRDAKGTALYIDLYKKLFNNENIKKDPTNNLIPQQIIQKLTGYKRNSDLYNYQVSHIFGKTKNIFMFEAPWNIVFVPKIIDPFTGHETKGDWPEEYQRTFLNCVYEKYSKFIEDYNNIVGHESIINGITTYIHELKEKNGVTKEIEQFEKDVFREFQIIK